MKFSKTKMMSKYFSEYEVFHSETAQKEGIVNYPTNDLASMYRIKNTLKVMDKIREGFGEPIVVTSFFRHFLLNDAVGGSPTSQHVIGEAVDFRVSRNSKRDNLDLLMYIKENHDFHQLINEFPNENGIPSWIHLGVKMNDRDNRNQVLLAQKNDKGLTEFVDITDGLKKKSKKSKTPIFTLGIVIIGIIAYIVAKN